MNPSAPRLNSTRSLPLILAGALSAVGFLASAALGADDLTPDVFQADVARRVAEAKARPGANPSGKISPTGRILVTPIVFHWGFEGIRGHGAGPLWEIGDKDKYVQAIVDQIHANILGGLQARGFVDTTPAALKAAGEPIESIGGTVGSDPARDRAGRSVSVYLYYSGKLKKWSPADITRLQTKYPSTGSAISVKINSTWLYRAHAKMGGEVILNHDVHSVLEVTVTSGRESMTAKIAAGKPLEAILPMPGKGMKNADAYREMNHFTVKIAAKYYADAVLAMFDNFVLPPAKAK